MKLLSKINSLIKNKKKNIVLIKSKLGLPTVRVCGVVLVDSGTNPCIGQSCSNDGSCPCNGWYNATCPTRDPCIRLGCTGYGGTGTTYKASINDQDGLSIIFFKGNNLEFKEAITSLNGVDSIIFGTASLKNQENCECVCVRYNSKVMNTGSLIKIYHLTSQKEKEILYQSEADKNYYGDLLDFLNIKISLVEFNSFQS